MKKIIGEYEVISNRNFKDVRKSRINILKYSIASGLVFFILYLLSHTLNYRSLSIILFILSAIAFLPSYLLLHNKEHKDKYMNILLAFEENRIIKIQISEDKDLKKGFTNAYIFYENNNKEVNIWTVNVKLIYKTDIISKSLLLDENILYMPF